MKIARILRLISSIFLIVCIFLPLTQCRGVVEEGYEGNAPLINNYIFHKNIVIDESGSIFRLFTWVLPFMLILFAFKFGISIKLSILQLASVFFAGVTWLGIVIMSHVLLWPAYLAAICIILLFILALIEFWCSIKKWRLTKCSS